MGRQTLRKLCGGKSERRFPRHAPYRGVNLTNVIHSVNTANLTYKTASLRIAVSSSDLRFDRAQFEPHNHACSAAGFKCSLLCGWPCALRTAALRAEAARPAA